MQNFIKEAVNYLDSYQLREIAHTCARLRSASFERMRESAFVRVPDPTNAKRTCDVKLTPIDSMLARSSLTSIIGAIDKTRANAYCHSAIAHWFDELWYKSDESMGKRRILIESVCRYDDVEFARVLFSYIISAMRRAYIIVDDQDNHPWYIALRASIPMGPEIARIMGSHASNQTQSARVFTFLMSRDITDLIRPVMDGDPADDMYKTIFIEAVVADNKQLARAMLDVLINNTLPGEDQLTIVISRKTITSSMVQFCKDNGVTIDLDAPCNYLDKEALIAWLHNDASIHASDGMDLDIILTLVAMNIRELDLIRSIIDKRDKHDGRDIVQYLDIVYTCCCANRVDIVDALIANKTCDEQHILILPEVYEFNPIVLARVRDLAIRQIHCDPSFVVYATSLILRNSKTVEQVRALLPPSIIASFARVIRSQSCTIVDTWCMQAELILRMYDVCCELGFTLKYWRSIIEPIMHSHNVDEIKHMTKSLSDITNVELVMCLSHYVVDYPHYNSLCSRVLDRESICYLVSRLDVFSKSRDMFMLGLLFNSREIMLKSGYRLCAKDCNIFAKRVTMYMHNNQSISEFFNKSEQFDCYFGFITHVDQFCQCILLSELSSKELSLVLRHMTFHVFDHINSVELIATALLRAMKRICTQHGRV